MVSVLPRRAQSPRISSPSALTIRNIVVAGHRTSVRLEPVMWEALRDIARFRGVGVNELVTRIDNERETASLTAAIRVYIVNFYRSPAWRGVADGASYAPGPFGPAVNSAIRK
jgi:predicted DNA-binding ribbon-helix-helix protein